VAELVALSFKNASDVKEATVMEASSMKIRLSIST
jgi:hypothetical protein